jgi:hypothetical protein
LVRKSICSRTASTAWGESAHAGIWQFARRPVVPLPFEPLRFERRRLRVRSLASRASVGNHLGHEVRGRGPGEDHREHSPRFIAPALGDAGRSHFLTPAARFVRFVERSHRQPGETYRKGRAANLFTGLVLAHAAQDVDAGIRLVAGERRWREAALKLGIGVHREVQLADFAERAALDRSVCLLGIEVE